MRVAVGRTVEVFVAVAVRVGRGVFVAVAVWVGRDVFVAVAVGVVLGVLVMVAVGVTVGAKRSSAILNQATGTDSSGKSSSACQSGMAA